MENASVKAYAHVRINVSGSPLECPGQSFSCASFCVLSHYQLFLRKPIYLYFMGLIYFWEWIETFPSIGRVRVKHREILLTLKGTVIRSGAIKMIEGEKIYECRVCKHRSDL